MKGAGMRRPILIPNAAISKSLNISLTSSSTKIKLSGLELEKRLRKKRSSAYMSAFKKLDAGGVTCSHAQIEELKNVIQSEFPDLEPSQYPIGILGRCYLGNPYEVHSLDVSLDIIQHYKKREPLPSLMEKGRSLALHPSYDFIEIYSESLRAISINGDVSIIKG